MINYIRINIVQKKSSIDPYWCTSLSCLILSALYLDFSQRDAYFYLTIIVQILIIIICIFLFMTKRPSYLKTKEKYISEWEEVKKIENEKNIHVIIGDMIKEYENYHLLKEYEEHERKGAIEVLKKLQTKLKM